MLPARHRLTRSGDITTVLRGKGSVRAGTRLIVVHAIATDARTDCPPRVGFAVSRAVGNAVVRNRVQRRLRAQLAARIPSLPSGVDLLVRATPASADATSAQLGAAVDDALPRVLGRLRPAPGAELSGR